ncbi:MAG: hypothetical protein H3C38_15695 [Rhodospirillales bacterium]|nr:hypothetical protein [Rhodospirillales bacterium]
MDFLKSLKSRIINPTDNATVPLQNVTVKNTIARTKDAVASSAEYAKNTAVVAYTDTLDTIVTVYNSATVIHNLEFKQLGSVEFYCDKFEKYKDLCSETIHEYFRRTFEVDKSTIEMVADVRNRLPVPAKTVDDIFDQCKREAIHRAVASFALGGILRDIDSRSEAKYHNLSETYKEFSDRSGPAMTDNPNFAALRDIRAQTPTLNKLDNAYNSDDPLFPADVDIDHVISKKEYYSDLIIRIGTTDEEFYSIINSEENLVFADRSFNRSMQDKNIHEFLDRRGRPDSENPELIYIDIKQQDGSTRTVTVNRKDVEKVYDQADAKRNDHRFAAATEAATTVVKTGAAMAAQQVVGLIMVETVDIFIDEIRNFAVNGSVITRDGWVQNVKEATARIQVRLADRFEERQIWARAKSLGIEAGVSGALSVIPQIIISMIIKMPSFVLSMIRECTLSIIRSARVLASEDPYKFDSLKVVLAGAAAAIIGAYVGRAISTAIAGVPLLNQFNTQITDIITGLLMTAVPLAAILIFEKNKERFNFVAATCAGGVLGTPATSGGEV